MWNGCANTAMSHGAISRNGFREFRPSGASASTTPSARGARKFLLLRFGRDPDLALHRRIAHRHEMPWLQNSLHSAQSPLHECNISITSGCTGRLENSRIVRRRCIVS